MDISGLIQVPSDNGCLPLQFPRYFTEHKALARIVQHRPLIRPHLFHNPVGKPSEAEYVDIHNPPVRMHRHQIHLGLHCKLMGHDD